MIDLIQNMTDLGVLETVRVLQELGDASIPSALLRELPVMPRSTLIPQRLDTIHDAIMASGKQEILLLSPEIALLERFSQDREIRFQLVIPSGIDYDTEKRIRNNIPKGAQVTFLKELDFPRDFFPSNGLLVAFGFQNDNRCLLLSGTLRMMEHYRGFMGKKVFVPINEDCERCCRPSSWIECYKGAYFNEQY